jgi:hypothetical protein
MMIAFLLALLLTAMPFATHHHHHRPGDTGGVTPILGAAQPSDTGGVTPI